MKINDHMVLELEIKVVYMYLNVFFCVNDLLPMRFEVASVHIQEPQIREQS